MQGWQKQVALCTYHMATTGGMPVTLGVPYPTRPA
jgi:hypothetical protein